MLVALEWPTTGYLFQGWMLGFAQRWGREGGRGEGVLDQVHHFTVLKN